MAEIDMGQYRAAVAKLNSANKKLAAQARAELAKSARGGKKSRVHTRSRATKNSGSHSHAKKNQIVSALMKVHGGNLNAVHYISQQDKSEHIDTNMLSDDPQKQLEEFRLDTLKHPRVDPKNLFVHVSFSRPKGHPLTAKQWQTFTRKFLQKIGADGAYTCTRHGGTDHDHLHLVFGRSTKTGGLVSLSNNRWAWRQVTREIEAEMHIQVQQSDVQRELASTSDTQVNASRRAARRGSTTDPRIDPSIIGQALEHATDFQQLASALKERGIQVQKAEKNGRTTGILFRKIGADELLSGSSISREFSLPNVQRRLEANQAQAQHEMQRRQAEQQRQAQQQNHQRQRGG